MWVTQTYIGDVERDAKFFVYYLYEDYNSEQMDLTCAIQRELEQLGEVYGDNVSLVMPNPRYARKIESEVREFRALWEAVREYLPGLLLSPVPLVRLKSTNKGCKFIPLRNDTPKHLANVIRSIRELADTAIASNKPEPSEAPCWFRRVVGAVELKPGIWGIRLDLKKLLE